MNKKKQSEINPNAWMTTFGDLIMLLLTFFVLLLTMKAMNKNVTEKMFKHFIAQDEVFSEYYGLSKGSRKTPDKISIKKQFINSSAVLKKTLKTEYLKLDKIAKISENKKALVISINTEQLFSSGSDKLTENGKLSLNIIGDLLEKISNEVLVLGHTDNIKIHKGKYRSNWELSCYRALSVLKYYTSKFEIEQSRIASGGFGDSKPLVPNNSKLNRAKNRRVEILLKKKRS